MLVNRKAKLILIYTAKRQLNLTDENYRALLEGAAGISSAADMDHEGQFDKIMDAFRTAGFVSTAAGKSGSSHPRMAKPNARPKQKGWWGCTPAQRAKIETLWNLVARNPTEQALRAMAARICKVDALPFIDQTRATKLILALSRMAQDAGYDPATGHRLDTQAPTN